MKRNKLIKCSEVPCDLHIPYQTLFTEEALDFLADLFNRFENRIDQLYYERHLRKYELKKSKSLPKFLNTTQRNDKSWKVRPVPPRLQNRRLDLGDVSPTNTKHFFDALNAEVQGIQVDFDDGHCPTWRNQIIGHYNVYNVIQQKNKKIKPLKQIPILMLRPRSWNMIEHNIMISGKKLPGPLVDFAILMYHNGYTLYKANCGPCFYLSKLESATEARLWNEIFVWSQERLNIPHGTIKACVLIENVLASFEMEEILFELKDHSLGLNCGIWDYAASIIHKFGHRIDFVLPDRNKYVNMERHFLKKYMQLVVQVCHSRGAHATGGMAAQLLTNHNTSDVIENVITAKKLEIETGVDGFMVYDIKLVTYMNKLWEDMCGNHINQINLRTEYVIYERDLLQMPIGGVTKSGLIHNIEVSILFIYNWLEGNGHFRNKGAIEDSATAEISRSQIWQWIKHMEKLEESGETITYGLIYQLAKNYVNENKDNLQENKLSISTKIFLDILTCPELPDFITSYLNDHQIFRFIDMSLSNDVRHKL